AIARYAINDAPLYFCRYFLPCPRLACYCPSRLALRLQGILPACDSFDKRQARCTLGTSVSPTESISGAAWGLHWVILVCFSLLSPPLYSRSSVLLANISSGLTWRGRIF